MIDRSEILEVASVRGLRPDVVEKDYVLGWVLAGIFSHPTLNLAWAFKGGTCLKKCYLETFRFSEDLDFTIEEEGQLETGFLKEAFHEVAEWIYDQTGIEIPPDRPHFNAYRNRRGGLNVEGRLYYRGPLQPRGSLPRVKLDLTADERQVYPPVWRPVIHYYTDCPEDKMFARCYAFEEVFGEKVRALGERCRPRDLYDVVNLYWNEDLRPVSTAVLHVVQEKCDFKGFPVPDAASIQPFHDELAGDWGAMLGHQLPALPPLEAFWNAVPEFLEWLLTGVMPAGLPRIPLGECEQVVGSEARSFDLGSGFAATLETIRFAAANRLCVDLDYEGSVHRVEPYAMSSTFDRVPFLYACPVDHGGCRRYSINLVMAVYSTDQSFIPRYKTELGSK